MHRWHPRLLLVTFASAFAALLILQSGFTAGVTPQTTPTVSATATTTTPTPHLELAVESPTTPVGSLITLHITYVNLGLPYTTITVDPPTLAQFDPPLPQPCKYDQDPTGCTVITFRALAPGTVTFRASATGEIFDPGCSCYRFSGGSDNGPATVMITPMTATTTATATMTPSATATSTPSGQGVYLPLILNSDQPTTTTTTLTATATPYVPPTLTPTAPPIGTSPVRPIATAGH